MQESHRKDQANHPDPESCADAVKRGRVVPEKLPNNGGTLPPAEGVEERRPTEGNTPKAAASRTLRESFCAFKRMAAPGIDGVTWKQYEVDF